MTGLSCKCSPQKGPRQGAAVKALSTVLGDPSAGNYSTQYERFKRRFAPFDDGEASERVVKEIWGL